MTTQTPDAVREAVQEDREAAWPFRAQCYGHLDRAGWMAGRYDHNRAIQAFASHRLDSRGEAIAALQAQEDAEDARSTCECEGEEQWEHCGPCSLRFGRAIDLRRAILSALDSRAGDAKNGNQSCATGSTCKTCFPWPASSSEARLPSSSCGFVEQSADRAGDEGEGIENGYTADDAVDFVFNRLASKLELSDWQVVEGSEEWEGDVSATLHRLLVDAGIIDDETGAVATLATPAPAVDAVPAGEVERLARIRTSMALLQQNSEGCAQNHYGDDATLHGMPGWLIDTKADLDAFTDYLAKWEADRG